MIALLPLLALLTVTCPQGQDPAVARFRFPDGAPGEVHRSELARELAVRHRRAEAGRDALKLIVDRELVSIDAKAEGVAPDAKAVAARVEEIRKMVLEGQGTSLESFLEAKRMASDEFEERYVRLVIAHERLVMKTLDLKDRREVTKELLDLWLQEARTRHTVVTDDAKLPPDIVAIVDGRRFDLADLGRSLLENATDEEREKFVRRIVLREILQREADRAGIRVTEVDTREEIDRRRARIEADPRYRGVRYEDWLLTTQGMTVDELARSAQMVATVQQQVLVDRLFPRAELERRLATERDSVLRRHGERRKIAIILLRALEAPNAIVTRDFEAARKELAALREEITSGRQSFLRAAQIHSEDPYSKVRGGELGDFPREAPDLPDALLAAAFAQAPLALSEPIRVPQGYVLVRVAQVTPCPDDAELLERLREDAAQTWLSQRLDEARVEMVQ